MTVFKFEGKIGSMGVVKRQSIFSTIVSYSGILIGFINIAYLFPKFFGAEELGLRAVLAEFSLILSQLALLGFSGVTNKFFPYFKNEEKNHHGLLFIIIVIPLIGFILLTGVFFLFKDELLSIYQTKSPLIVNYYYLLFPITFFTIYTIIMETYSMAYLKIVYSNFLREVLLRLLTTLLIILFILHLINIDQFWWLFAASYGITVILLILYIKKIAPLSLKPDFNFLSKDLFKRMLTFGFFAMFTGIASMIVHKIDTVMLSYMLGLKETGIYALAIYMTTVVETPKRAINQIVNPLIASFWKENELSKINLLYKKSSLTQLIAGGFIFLLMWMNIDYIFYFIPKNEVFIAGKYVFFFVGLAKLTDMAAGVNSEIIGNSVYFRFGLFSVVILAGLTILTNYIFIPLYGINGAAFATFLSISFFNIVKFFFLKFKFNLQPFTIGTLQVLTIGGITYLVVFFMPKTEIIFFDLVINSATIFFLYLVPIIYFKISPDMTEIVEQKLKFLNFKKK